MGGGCGRPVVLPSTEEGKKAFIIRAARCKLRCTYLGVAWHGLSPIHLQPKEPLWRWTGGSGRLELGRILTLWKRTAVLALCG